MGFSLCPRPHLQEGAVIWKYLKSRETQEMSYSKLAMDP